MAGSQYEVEKRRFDGHEAYALVDNVNEVEALIIPSFGANMISLAYKGKELMKGPESYQELEASPNRFGNPVLMPPNRISNGVFQFQGREFRFPLTDKTGIHHIHGLVKSAPWRVESSQVDDTGATLRVSIHSTDHDDIMASMPIDFVLELVFSLIDGEVSITTHSTNLDKVDMPFGIGFHPYFLAPIGVSKDQTKCFIKCPAQRRWELVECFPTGRKVPVAGPYDLRDWVSLEGLRLDDVYTDLVLEDEVYKLGIEDREAGIGLEFAAGPEFPHWVLFTGTAGSGFVCLEPYTMVTNAFNLNLPAELSGALVIKPNRSFTGTWSMRPYTIGG